MTGDLAGSDHPLHALRIPSGWTLRHNNFVDAPLGHSHGYYGYYHGLLLLAYHAEWDLLIDLGWLPGPPTENPAEAGSFLLRVVSGDRTGEESHRYESRDPAAVVTELERLFAELPVRYAPRVRYADYSSAEVDMLMGLYKAMRKLRSEEPAFDASCQIEDLWIEDKLRAIAPIARRYWEGIDLETRDGDSRWTDKIFYPNVLRLCDWSHPRREKENDLFARWDTYFRGQTE